MRVPALIRDQIQRNTHDLEQIHRRGVGDHQFIVIGAYQTGNLVADALRKVNPPRRVPAADLLASPFRSDHLLHARGRGSGQCAQRVSIEVNHVRRQVEQFAQCGERILAIQALAILSCRHQCSAVWSAVTGHATDSGQLECGVAEVDTRHQSQDIEFEPFIRSYDDAQDSE